MGGGWTSFKVHAENMHIRVIFARALVFGGGLRWGWGGGCGGEGWRENLHLLRESINNHEHNNVEM